MDPVIPDPVDPDPVDPVIPDPIIPDPVDPDPVDPEPVDPVIPDPTIPDIGQSDTPPITEHQFRPEVGSYLANNYAANTLFMTRLHDRLGETQYTDMLTGEKKVTSLWMRNVGAHTRFNDGSGQLKPASTAMCYKWEAIWHSGALTVLTVGILVQWQVMPTARTARSRP